ncbi:hypothetical protein KVR01_011892 [Diaporthe batatas]|uniref:uncharacterized protein n=1 Tax=Diaporthe batatas TaxID=748121 RepID=UPI001D04C366|nr:uncharacterized protein KVR01_011892 [Diaporthe batatas]KAG8158131.1 hypothetical protein KVR01_011892 [Diaporthe batatas]
MLQLKVLICGGGIAGNALAFWLSKANHDVTVVERFPDLRATGLQVDLRGAGIEVLKRMGLEEQFRAHAAEEKGIEFVSSSGKQCAYFPANTSGKGAQSFTSDYEIMRGDLTKMLYDASRATFRFGISIESYQDKGDGVEVVFSDGTSEHFDLLVGADGQWSRTRNMMLERDAPDPMHFLRHNVFIAYYTMPRAAKGDETYDATAYMAAGNRMMMKRGSDPHRMQAYLLVLKDAATGRLKEAHRGGVAAEKAAMADIFRGAGWRTEELIKGMEASDDFYLERLGVVKLDSWSRGRVVLAGDAAHCPSAMTGMGTTSAIVGTYILAGEIARHCGKAGGKDGLAVALKEYDRKLRPFMTRVQEGVVEGSVAWDLWPSSWFGVAVLNLILKLVTVTRLMSLATWIIPEDGKDDWKLPEYEELAEKAL